MLVRNAAIVVFLSWLAVSGASGDESTGEDLVAMHEELVGDLLEKLSDDQIWSDVGCKDALVGLLEAAGALRSDRTVPVLMDHLSYDAYFFTQFFSRNLPFRKRRPAAQALAEIGMPAVPYLLDVLKAPEMKTAPPLCRGSRRHLAIGCLISIFGGFEGHGIAMARKRIELELLTASADEATYLKEALEVAVLNISRAARESADKEEPDGAPEVEDGAQEKAQ